MIEEKKSGCQDTERPGILCPDNCRSMTLDFTLIGGLSSPNPEIRLSCVPPGTAFLKVVMVDLDCPDFNHGNGIVPYDGSGHIPEGALSDYLGPEPPCGVVHRYEITVQALNKDQSEILGEGRLVKNFP